MNLCKTVVYNSNNSNSNNIIIITITIIIIIIIMTFINKRTHEHNAIFHEAVNKNINEHEYRQSNGGLTI